MSAVWLARDFLRTAGRPIDIPPCVCSADLCPPIKTEENEMTTTTEQMPRMRARRGRVMHVVKRRWNDELESACRKPLGVKGVSTTIPRVHAAPAEDWTTDNLLDYPDCKHCPTDEPAQS